MPDWGRDRWAYLDPLNCDETCIQQKCNKDPACKGYTWALGHLAGSLKNLITGSQPWGGYRCKVKITCIDSNVDQALSVSSSARMMPQVIVSLLLFQEGQRLFKSEGKEDALLEAGGHGDFCWIVLEEAEKSAVVQDESGIPVKLNIYDVSRRESVKMMNAVLAHWMAPDQMVPSRLAAQRLQGATPEECIPILNELHLQQLRLNTYHAAAAFTACKRTTTSVPEKWPWTLEILEELQGLRVEADDVGYSCAIASCRDSWEMAMALLVQLLGRGDFGAVRSHGAALSACATAKRWQEALGLLRWFEDLNFEVDVISYGAAINACDWPEALKLLEEMKMKSCEANEFCYTAAMKSLGESSDWSMALHLFAELPQPDRRALNAALSALARATKHQRCLQLLRDAGGINLISYNIALGATSRNSDDWPTALVLLEELGDMADSVSFSSAMASFEGCGRWKQALALLHSRTTQDHGSLRSAIATMATAAQWQRALLLAESGDIFGGTAAVNACGNAGRWEQALQLVEDLRPILNSFAFTGLLTACGNAQRWQMAIQLLSSEDFGNLCRNAFCFSAAIAACGKAAQWQWAMKLFRRMPDDLVQPNEICLNAALNAACERGKNGTHPWREALVLVQQTEVPLDDAGLHILMCCAETIGHWQLALCLMAEHAAVMSTASLDAAAMACCRAQKWQEAIFLERDLLDSPEPGERLETLAALKVLFEAGEAGGAMSSSKLLHGLAENAQKSMRFPKDLDQVLRVAAELETQKSTLKDQPIFRRWLPKLSATGAAATGRLPYQKEMALLRHVLRCKDPSVKNVEMAMESFGDELGAAGGWAKFAAGSKADVLLSSAMGATSPPLVLDVGAYCGGSALRLAGCLPGAQVIAIELDTVNAAIARVLLAFAGLEDRVKLFTGHTRQLLPRFDQSFSAIFLDLWGSQYAEVLSLLQRHRLVKQHGLLCADNVLRTAAAEFLWRVANPTSAPGFHTLLVPVNEDWMSVTVVNRGDSNVFEVPPAMVELQHNSERWRQRATNVGMEPEEFGDMAQHTKAVLKSVSIAPVLEKRVLFFPNLFLRASKGGKYVERCFRMVYIFRVT
eukprot:symbB.v1.2.014659.t1/scaffold1077.1/size139779/6